MMALSLLMLETFEACIESQEVHGIVGDEGEIGDLPKSV